MVGAVFEIYDEVIASTSRDALFHPVATCFGKFCDNGDEHGLSLERAGMQLDGLSRVQRRYELVNTIR